MRTIKPLDITEIVKSVSKTGYLLVVDHGWKTSGFAAEIICSVIEQGFGFMKSAPRRVTLPDCPTPTSPALSDHYYPRAINIANEALEIMDPNRTIKRFTDESKGFLDVPDSNFTGPF